ncbi:aminobenzoyl-glutamate transporter [Acidobacteria bacterium Mor1]|nr:aminobenzoyl-glutamate transporter [Acidobacteria bacterium Mor1]
MTTNAEAPKGLLDKFLNAIEVAGNKLPDPAVLFLMLMGIVWLLSWPLSMVDFNAIHPGTGEPIAVANQVNGAALATLMSTMVTTFVTFAPLGVVLVALLGIGVAEHTGFIGTLLKSILSITPQALLTPMIILVGVASHYAVDAGYVLVIPLGGVIFYAAGRHPLAGIMAAFAGVSGGFSANFLIPSALDPLLQGFTQAAAQVADPNVQVSVVNNNIFTAASTVVITLLGWFITDRIVEPRCKKLAIDGDPDEMPKMEKATSKEISGMWAGLAAMAVGVIALVAWLVPEDSALRLNGEITNFGAPIMRSIVPLIFLLFLIPGIVYGYIAGTVKSHRDIVQGMSKSMSTMGYYLVLAFFCSLFIWMFGQSNIGILLAVKGADVLKAMDLPGGVTIFGIVLLVGAVNLLVGSASAKWGLIAPVVVPMLMQLGISPDLTQAAYRVGDSTTNIITPLMPYFPLVVVFCQRYVKSTGIGTVVSMMLPYSVVLIISWSILLVLFWMTGIPLGWSSSYVYTP